MKHWRKYLLLVRTLTVYKVFNFVKLFISFHLSRWRGTSLHWGNPSKIGFEPTTACNLRCPECPSGLRSFTRPTGMANLELFQSLIDQTKKDLVYLLLYFQGEPYLNKDFFSMVKYASKRGIYSASSTNGHFLHPTNARKTVESGLSELIISIDGVDQETYSAYRKGGKLSKVLEGVKNLVEARKAARSLHPFIIIQFLVVGPNEHQVEAIQILGKELGVDKVALKTAQIYEFEKGSPLIPQNDRYSRYKKKGSGSYEIKNPLDNQCWKLWHGAEVTWDGKVLPCCFDKDGQFQMGSLALEKFQNIWEGLDYQEFRNSLLKSRAEIDMCKNCSEGTRVWA